MCPVDNESLTRVFPGSLVIDGKYELTARLGKGGMGSVYRATHLGLERAFAVKLVAQGLGGTRWLEQFRTEARVLGKLHHPNIVEVTDFGYEHEREIPYLVMELLSGESLADRVRREERLTPRVALPLLRQIAEALDYAHHCGISHSDLKPSNVVLVPSRGGSIAKVVDLGLARFFGREDHARSESDLDRGPGDSDFGESKLANPERETITVGVPRQIRSPGQSNPPWVGRPGAIMGTPSYMAPEILLGKSPNPGTDIFALGVLVHRILVGRTPFGRPNIGVEHSESRLQAAAPSTLQPAIPVQLDEPMLSMISLKPEARPQSARVAVDSLEQAWRRASRKTWLAREGFRRAGLASLVAALAPLLWLFPGPARDWDNRFADARFALASLRPPDPRLLLVLIDDSSLGMSDTALVDLHDEAGRLLQQVVDRGARVVGIDLLLGEAWSDPASAFVPFVLENADSLVLAAFSTDQDVIGTGAVQGLVAASLGPSRTAELFGFTHLKSDPDGIVRRTSSFYSDRDGIERPSFPYRVASLFDPELSKEPTGEESIWIDWRLDHRRIERVSWGELAGYLADDSVDLSGRLVLLGATYAGSGDRSHAVPHPMGFPAHLPGVMIHALGAHTFLDGSPVRDWSGHWAVIVVVWLVAWCQVATVLVLRSHSVAGLSFLLVGCIWIASSIGLFLNIEVLVPTVLPLCGILVATSTAGILRFTCMRIPAY